MHFLKDVIYNKIDITEPWVWELINTSEFKRLHHIKQLGFSYVTFPCATHSRFCHSLGVFELGRHLIETVKPNIAVEQKRELLTACLLHDIGHGPHSHEFEQLVNFDHEEMSVRIITAKSTNINKILNKYNINSTNVAKIIKKEHELDYFNKIVSSQIDVDRLDYLKRDSHYTGVSFGEFDVDILFKHIVLQDNKLIFDEKLTSWIENFLVGRFHMYKELYNKPKNIINTYIISQLFKRIKCLVEHGAHLVNKNNAFDIYMPWFLNKEISIDDFLKTNDINLINLIEACKFELDSEVLRLYDLHKNYDSKKFVVNNEMLDCDLFMKIEKSYFEIYKKDDPILLVNLQTGKSIDFINKSILKNEVEKKENLFIYINK